MALTVACLTAGSVDGGSTDFIRGDVDGNGRVSALVDALYLLRGLVGDGDFDCLDAADINDNGRVNLVDAIYLLAWAFNNGDALPDPVECGEEDTDDDLDCESYECP